MRRQTKASGATTLSMLLSANAVPGKMSLMQAAQQKTLCLRNQFSHAIGKIPVIIFVNAI